MNASAVSERARLINRLSEKTSNPANTHLGTTVAARDAVRTRLDFVSQHTKHAEELRERWVGRWERTMDGTNWENYLEWWGLSRSEINAERGTRQSHTFESISSEHATISQELATRAVAQYTVMLDGSFRTIPEELQVAGGTLMDCVKEMKWAHSWEFGALRTRHELLRQGKSYEMTSTRTVTQPNVMRVRSEVRSNDTGLVVAWGERDFLRVRVDAKAMAAAAATTNPTIKLEEETSLHTTLVTSISPPRSASPERGEHDSAIKTREQIMREASERRQAWKKAHETAPNLLLASVMTAGLPAAFQAPSCRASP